MADLSGPACTVREGNAPLVVSMPHTGTEVPDALLDRLSAAGRGLDDTDWHIDRLYAFAEELDATLVVARWSRYVLDVNRMPDGRSLYPGQSVTELCPTTTFDEQPLYQPGEEPDAAEIAQRRERVWQPYHQALQDQLARLQDQHGQVVLWDAHSIRSVVPRFFDGRLPDLNIGTAGGMTCAPTVLAAVAKVLAEQDSYSHVLDGRFKGGAITRLYGQPDKGVHAVQLEQAQCTYMEEQAPWAYREVQAAAVQPVLRGMLAAAVAALPA